MTTGRARGGADGLRIAIYGATGKIGTHIVDEARKRGHTVTALSRNRTDDHRQSWVFGDAADASAVTAIAAAHDVVVSALGPVPETEATPPFPEIIRGMADACGSTRLVVVGGAGTLLDASGTRLVDGAEFPDALRPAALSQAAALDVLRRTRSSLDWTYLSPAPRVVDGPRGDEYRVGGDEPAGPAVSREILAVAILDEIERPRHRRARFTVADGERDRDPA